MATSTAPPTTSPTPNNDEYQSPFNSRYCSPEMKALWSPRTRFSTWRHLWLWLAESEQTLGLPIPDLALTQMRAALTITDAEFPAIAVEEAKRRHDVMAHVHGLGLAAPAAESYIHLGATSCYVTDNADLIFLKKGLGMLLRRLVGVVRKLGVWAMEKRDMPCLGYTHGQAAQMVTVGKRACLWIQDLLMDVRNVARAREDLRFRGVKGATGTQATFLALFGGDDAKVEELDRLVVEKAGFESTWTITSQTYSRKVDVDVLNALSSFGATCERLGGDVRHLAMVKEMEEPFEDGQIGSSAMAYKRNPMRAERLCSLGRKLQGLSMDATATYSHQWFERTLDDSAIRRISLPESFLCADACLRILDNIVSGFVLYPAVIARHIREELPFMATEKIIMHLSLPPHNISRQTTHEHIRVLSQQAAYTVKELGKENDLIERIRTNVFFKPMWPDLEKLLDPRDFVGRCEGQVEKFLKVGGEVDTVLNGVEKELGVDVKEGKGEAEDGGLKV